MPGLNNILKRHATTDPKNEAAEENIEDKGGWGLLRGVQDRALALECRKKTGEIMAIPYALIEAYLYSPHDGVITLRASAREIRIRGRHLAGPSSRPLNLFTALIRQRVPYIAEHSRGDGPPQPETIYIESIDW
ncbi:MAG: hypothetical protein QM754_07980 [Tepidisphaeraceae bacterium]